MYNGPYYYIQPNNNQHKRCLELVYNKTADGALLLSDKIKPEKILKDFTPQYLSSGLPTLTDFTQYSPENLPEIFSSSYETEQLHDVSIRHRYVELSLSKQHELKTTGYIIPNLESKSVNKAWFQSTSMLASTGQEWIAKYGDSSKPVWLSVSIASHDLTNEEHRRGILNTLSYARRDVRGVYLSIIGINHNTDDSSLLSSLMEFIYGLKLQRFSIILSGGGSWIPITFILGLDIFSNDAFFTAQKLESRRDLRSKKPGFGRPKYWNVWSPILLSYIRYPDDAELIKAIDGDVGLRRILGTHTGYAPSSNATPTEIYTGKKYEQSDRLNHFCADFASMAKSYRKLNTLNERFLYLEQQLNTAIIEEKRIGSLLAKPRGKEKEVWLRCVNSFVEKYRDELNDIYD